MPPFLELRPFGATDAGKVRQNNEDSLLVGDGADETLFAVADGIGGFEAGEVASSIAIDVLKDLEPGSPFGAAIEEANRRILAVGRGDERLSGMGTTIVAVRFGERREEPVAEVAHVGDSRAYLVRGGELKPVTEDHSLVAELVRNGDLTRAQAAEHPQKNLITRALGAEEAVETDTAVLPVEAGDRFLLCSDGLTDMVPEERIAEILTSTEDAPEEAARQLISDALDAGGNDNVTVVVVDVKEYAPPPEEREEREDRSGGTREMPAVAPPTAPSGASSGSRSAAREAPRGASGGPWVGAGADTGETRTRKAARRKRASRSPRPSTRSARRSKTIGRIVRGLAVLLVVIAILTPVYLWGSSRYFFGFEGGEVVAYRGLPYSVGELDLNEEWRRPGVDESDVPDPYQQRIETHQLYTHGKAERILEGLER